MIIHKNVLLAPFTTFNIGGPADFFCVAESVKNITEAISLAKQKRIEFFILGTGANILIGDKGFRGLVIKNEAKKYQISNIKYQNRNKTNNSKEEIIFLNAESGCVVADLINFTQKMGLSGLEHFAGIPSTVGGALWQNLHFLSPDRESTVFIGDILSSAILFTNSGIEKVSKDFFKFSYDYSILHDTKDVVLSAIFKLIKESPKIISERISANLNWREEKHPDFAWRVSAGSVFKKIEGYGAGRLIEKVGLKGYKIGGAQISPKHANFIINTGNATAKDVRELIDLVQEKIKKEFNFDLITEISFIGEF